MKNNVTVSAPYMWCWVLKPGHFGKQTSSTLDVMKCGDGEGWSGSAGPFVWDMKCYIVSEEGDINYIEW